MLGVLPLKLCLVFAVDSSTTGDTEPRTFPFWMWFYPSGALIFKLSRCLITASRYLLKFKSLRTLQQQPTHSATHQ